MTDLSKFYTQGHMILITSTREGFPMVLMEAMSYGVVPISTNVGGIKHHIKTGENGFLVNESNEEEIINAFIENIHFVIQSNTFKALSEQTYKYSKKNFLLKHFSEKYQNLFQSYIFKQESD